MILFTKHSLHSSHVCCRSFLRPQIRCFGATDNIVRPRIHSAIDSQSASLNSNKGRTSPKAYKSRDESSRLLNVYESVVDRDGNDLDTMMAANRQISKSMKKRMNRQSTKWANRGADISANFTPNVSAAERADDIHGIIGMFADDADRGAEHQAEDEWYSNPNHIEAVEEWLRTEKLPMIDPELAPLRSARLTEDMVQRDRIRGGSTRKVVPRRIRRKLRRKQRGNDVENMSKNELIQHRERRQSSQSTAGTLERTFESRALRGILFFVLS